MMLEFKLTIPNILNQDLWKILNKISNWLPNLLNLIRLKESYPKSVENYVKSIKMINKIKAKKYLSLEIDYSTSS